MMAVLVVLGRLKHRYGGPSAWSESFKATSYAFGASQLRYNNKRFPFVYMGNVLLCCFMHPPRVRIGHVRNCCLPFSLSDFLCVYCCHPDEARGRESAGHGHGTAGQHPRLKALEALEAPGPDPVGSVLSVNSMQGEWVAEVPQLPQAH